MNSYIKLFPTPYLLLYQRLCAESLIGLRSCHILPAPSVGTLSIPKPKARKVYYKVSGKIDKHNHACQDNLKIEMKLETKRWDVHVNCSCESFNFGNDCCQYMACLLTVHRR